jgi:hypothetical protein
LNEKIESKMKLRNIVVAGMDKSGKKIIVRRAVLQYLKDHPSGEAIDETFDFKSIKITREAVSIISIICINLLKRKLTWLRLKLSKISLSSLRPKS